MNICDNIDANDLKGEEWMSVINHPFYRISNLGRIKSITRIVRTKGDAERTTIGRILKQQTNLRGYKFVTIYDDEAAPKLKLIARLVADHFIPNPENKSEVNHKNGIKSDNRAENLEWNTRIENQRHAIRTGLRVAPRGTSHYKNKKVKNTLTGVVHEGIREAAIAEGIIYGTLKTRIRSKNSIYEYV